MKVSRATCEGFKICLHVAPPGLACTLNKADNKDAIAKSNSVFASHSSPMGFVQFCSIAELLSERFSFVSSRLHKICHRCISANFGRSPVGVSRHRVCFILVFAQESRGVPEYSCGGDTEAPAMLSF